MATLVINHCREGGRRGPLSRATLREYRRRSLLYVLAYVSYVFLRDLPGYGFLPAQKGGEKLRGRKIREPSARISSALICFVCIGHYGEYKVSGRKTSTMVNGGTKGRAKVPVDKSSHVGKFGHVKMSRDRAHVRLKAR